jgi:predicted unusual protein kinase regulating ubiquinone biosynthesis (AarF/ABC1/UbiB family)
VQALPVERRNRLGRAFLELYLKELVQFRLMQTDPHLGNYLIQLSPDGNDRLVLFDFGAVRDVPEPFLKSYRHLIAGGFHHSPDKLIQGGLELGLLQPDDSEELKKKYVDLCLLLTEPFEEGLQPYDWAASDLPKRVAAQVAKLAFQHRLRAPPAELVFLDRKLGGVFIFLSVLKCQMSARDLVENVL